MPASKTELLQIAETIRRQLAPAAYVIGMRNLVALGQDKAQRGGLQFNVRPARGAAIKANKVLVRLRWDDTYTVEFWKTSGSARVTPGKLDSADMVYADVLAELVLRHLGYTANQTDARRPKNRFHYMQRVTFDGLKRSEVAWVDSFVWDAKNQQHRYMVHFKGRDGRTATIYPLESELTAVEENPSRRRKYLGKRYGGTRGLTARTSKAERQFCVECKRYVSKGGKATGRRVPVPRQSLAVSHGYCKACAAQVRTRWKAEAEAIKAKKQNPPAELAAAAELAERFNGKPPRRIRSVKIRWPRALMHVGPCAQLDYVSDKWDGKLRQYFHEFTGRCDLFAAPAAQPDGDGLLILKGKFKLKPEGITG